MKPLPIPSTVFEELSSPIGANHEANREVGSAGPERNIRASVPSIKEALEPFTTIKDAASQLGLPSWKLARAAKQGLFPTYRILNGRMLARISEINAAIEASRNKIK